MENYVNSEITELSTLEKLNAKIKEIQSIKRLVLKQEIIFKGENRVEESTKLMEKLDTFQIIYEPCEFKSMIIIRIV